MKRLIVLLALLCTGCKVGQTISVPVSACTRQLTGRTEDQTTMQCFGMDAKTGACTMWMPVTTTYREVLVNCAFTEME